MIYFYGKLMFLEMFLLINLIMDFQLIHYV